MYRLTATFIYKRDAKELANGDNADIYPLVPRYRHAGGALVMFSPKGAYQFGSKQDATVGNPLCHSTTAGATSTPTPAKSGSIIFSRCK